MSFRALKRCFRIQLMVVLYLTLAATSWAQSIDVQGGSSNLFNAKGGTIALHGDNYEGWIGAGIVNDRFRLGSYAQTTIHHVTVGAGDSSAQLNLPTDLFTGGQYFQTRGVGFKTALGERTDVFAFGGASSLGYYTPYLRTAETDTPIGMLFLDHAFTPKVHFFSRNVFSSRQTSINGLNIKLKKWLSMAVAGGVGSNQAYGSASAHVDLEKLDLKLGYSESGKYFRRVATPNATSSEVEGGNVLVVARPTAHLRFTAGHENYLQPDLEVNNPGAKAKTNQLGADWEVYGFRFGSALYETEYKGIRGTGTTLTAGRKITNWFDTSGTFFRSNARGSERQSMFSSTFREKLHPRFNLLQIVTHGSGKTSVSYGGEFISNLLRVSVDYQNVYVPFNVGSRSAFQQAIMVDSTLRPFGSFQLHFGTLVDAAGRTRYTLSVSDFLYHSRSGVSQGGQASLRLPRYIVKGLVTTENGEPLSGAAIYVDGQLAYTNADGRFFLRFQKTKPQPIRVATDEFTAPGRWLLVSAPAKATPQTEDKAVDIEIKVKKASLSDEERAAIEKQWAAARESKRVQPQTSQPPDEHAPADSIPTADTRSSDADFGTESEGSGGGSAMFISAPL